ncbi:MAG TPA: CbiQ family ECF transporter T component, partial [Chroococcales cyanobacterium]
LGLPPFLVSLSPDFQLSIVPNGGFLALQVSLRMLASISCLLFLALTTPVPELLALLRSCRLPLAVIEVALLTYRFLFAFSETAQTIYQAQCMRLGYRTFLNGLRSAAMLVASLFILALDRARALERGLAARGYGGELEVVPSVGILSFPILASILFLQMLLALALAGIPHV